MIHEDTLLPDVRKCEEIIRNARKIPPTRRQTSGWQIITIL